MFLISCLAASTTIDSGNVSGVWYASSSPYLVYGDISIPNLQALTIEPGVQVLFQGYYKLTVNGRLIAQGASGDSIVFSTGSPEQKWRGIIWENTSAVNDSSLLNYTIFSGGDASLDGTDSRGGALRILGTNKVGICNSRFQSCAAGTGGGAIYINNSNISIRNSIFKNCFTTGNGGAIFLDSGSNSASGSLHISDCLFSSNSANSVGGGINLSVGNNLVSNCSFYGNYAYQGSAVAFWFCAGEVSDCLMQGNSVYDSGAGLYIRDSSVIAQRNIIRANTWTSEWGTKAVGIMVSGSNCTLLNNTVVNNHSFFAGGGIYILSSFFRLLNNVIANNHAGYGVGGLYVESWDPASLIQNNTICHNSSGGTGGVELKGSFKFINNIIWGNTAASGQLYLRAIDANLLFDYNCIEGGMAAFAFHPECIWSPAMYGSHNTTGYPQFANPSAGAGLAFDGYAADWSISASSSCYNSGDPATDVSLYSLDPAGNPRISEAIIDIGAYEFMNPAVPQAPQNLNILPLGAGAALLEWDPVSLALNGAPITVSHYTVYYADSPLGPWLELGSTSSSQYQLSNLELSSHRFFLIRANSVE